MRLRLASLGMAVLIALAGAAPASAALGLAFESPRGAPGEWLHARTAGSGAFAPGLRSSSYAVYLAPQTDTSAVTGPDHPALRFAGWLVVDARGDGQLAFRVPDLPAGRYAVFIFCPGCAAYSAGQALLWAADIDIAPGADLCGVWDARVPGLAAC